MQEILSRYLPQKSVEPLFELIQTHAIHLKIVNERKSRHGDYRKLPTGNHQITVNANLNKYRFLLTLVHEIAHLVAFEKYGPRIKPHGLEWKHTFQQLMLPFISPAIFPMELLPFLARHFKNPTASSDTDAHLSVALKRFDPATDKSYVFEIPVGSIFKIHNGKLFRKGNRRIKRYECVEVATGKTYVFQPHVEVEVMH